MGDEFEFESLRRSNGVEGIVWPYLLASQPAEPTPRAVETLPVDTEEVALDVIPGLAIDGRRLAAAGLRSRGRRYHES